MLLVRHGATKLNSAKNPIVRGWKDEPMAPQARADVRATARELRPYGPKALVSSDFMRDAETAQVLAAELGIASMETDFDARTWDVGTYSGKPEDEARDAINDLYRRSWETPPGSQESFDEFAARWLKFLDKRMQAAQIEAMRPYLVVTHGRNIALTDSNFNFKLPEDGLMPMPSGYGVLSITPERKIAFEVQGEAESVCIDI